MKLRHLLVPAVAVALLGTAAAGASYIRIQTSDAFDYSDDTHIESPNGHVNEIHTFGYPPPLGTRDGRSARLIGFRLLGAPPELIVEKITLANLCDSEDGLAYSHAGSLREKQPGVRTRPIRGFAVRHTATPCWYVAIEVRPTRTGTFTIPAAEIEYTTGIGNVFRHRQRVPHSVTLIAIPS
jgi:hypothetical protein